MRHYSRDVELAIDKLNAELHIILMIHTNHHACLIEPLPVVATYLDFCLKLTSVGCIEERTVIDREAIMGYTPEVGLCRHVHLKSAILDCV